MLVTELEYLFEIGVLVGWSGGGGPCSSPIGGGLPCSDSGYCGDYLTLVRTIICRAGQG